MSIARKIKYRIKRRELRVRKRFSDDKPRVSVFRSLSNVYAQIIDDKTQKTLVSESSLNIKAEKKNKTEVAHQVGIELAKKALNKGIKEVVFDRGSFLYHGRVKALAEGLREGGIKL